MAQRGEKITGVKKLVVAIQKLLRAIGLDKLADKLEARTDAEALMTLHKAELFVKSGKTADTATVGDVYGFFARKNDTPAFSRKAQGTGQNAATPAPAAKKSTQTKATFAVPKVTHLDNVLRAMQARISTLSAYKTLS